MKLIFLVVITVYFGHAATAQLSSVDNEIESRMLGGFDSPLIQPYMAYIRTYNKSAPETIFTPCSGAIISTTMVVTSATCMILSGGSKPSPAETGDIIAGTKDRTVTDPTDGVQFRTIKSYIFHPAYRFNSKENDIALLTMNKAFTVTATVAPIPIAKSSAVAKDALAGKTKVLILGWGLNATLEAEVPTEHKILQVLYNVNVGKQADCVKQLLGAPWYFRLPVTSVCYNVSAATGMCYGDDGAVAIAELKMGKLKDPVWQLVGIGSWFIPAECREPKQVPQIFNRVADYAKWIKDNGGPDPQK